MARVAAVGVRGDRQRRLTVVGNATWATVVIGDYVNVVGMYDTSGNLPRVRRAVARVQPVGHDAGTEPIGSTTAPADLASVNCGGGMSSSAATSGCPIAHACRQAVTR